MSDVITTAGAASPEAASPVPTEAQRLAAAAALMGGSDASPRVDPTPTPAAPAPATPEEPEPSLKELIRQSREARQRAQQEQTRSRTLEQELKAAREEAAKAKSDRLEFEADPVGFAKARGWTPEQQLLYGKSLLFDLAPEKADPDFRIKMFEDRQKREEAKKEREAREAEEKAQQEAVQAQIQEFYADTVAAARSFEAGSYPESEAWFGDDLDSYMQSMMATAKNLAARATAEGRVADLTPAALASALEAETARRMAARDARKQKRTAPQGTPAANAAPVNAPAGGTQSAETLSTRNLMGAGTPAPAAMDEKTRIQRAIQAGFRNK